MPGDAACFDFKFADMGNTLQPGNERLFAQLMQEWVMGLEVLWGGLFIRTWEPRRCTGLHF